MFLLLFHWTGSWIHYPVADYLTRHDGHVASLMNIYDIHHIMKLLCCIYCNAMHRSTRHFEWNTLMFLPKSETWQLTINANSGILIWRIWQVLQLHVYDLSYVCDIDVEENIPIGRFLIAKLENMRFLKGSPSLDPFPSHCLTEIIACRLNTPIFLADYSLMHWHPLIHMMHSELYNRWSR